MGRSLTDIHKQLELAEFPGMDSRKVFVVTILHGMAVGIGKLPLPY